MSYVNFTMDDGTNLPDGYYDFINISYSVYENDFFSFTHDHFFEEFFFIVSGSGWFFYQGERFDIKSGDLIITNRSVEHHEVSSEHAPLVYYVMGINGIEFSGIDRANFIVRMDEIYSETLFFFRQILNELKNRRENYRTLVNNYIDNLIILLQRKMGLKVSRIEPSKLYHPACAKLKEYIDAHYNSDISLGDLTKIAYLSEPQLIRIFHKHFGMTPFAYVLSRRIEASKSLLATTKLAISMVGESVGFSSPSNFIKKFKELTGTTPNQYRRQTSDNL